MARDLTTRNPLRWLPRASAALALLATLAAGAHADRRYFPYTYSPFLGPPKEMEVEAWLTTRSGKQDPGVGTAWSPRVEFEYVLHRRFGASAYLNFDKQPGQDLKFQSPSIEMVYRLAEPGAIAGDPALYLETTESGDELELESKLLLAGRRGRWLAGSNVIGEFEFRHDRKELLSNGDVLRNGVAFELSGGVARDVTSHVSFGIESRYRSEHPNFGSEAAAFAAVGPAMNLAFGESQVAFSVLPQVWGTPHTSGRRNLEDFEKVQARIVLGFEL